MNLNPESGWITSRQNYSQSSFFKSFLIFYGCLWLFIMVYYSNAILSLVSFILIIAIIQSFNPKHTLHLMFLICPFVGLLTFEFYGTTLKLVDIFLLIYFILHIFPLLKSYINLSTQYLLPFYLFAFIILLNIIYVQINAPNIELEYGVIVKGFNLKSIGMNSIKNLVWLFLYITLMMVIMKHIRTIESLNHYLNYFLWIQTMIGCWTLSGIIEYYITGSPSLSMWKHGTSFFRLRGGDWEPSYYGTYLLILLPLYLLPFLKKIYIYNRGFHLFAMIVFFLNLILSLSSATWMLLPFILGINFLFILYYIREKSISIPLIFTSVIIIFSISIGLALAVNQMQAVESIAAKIFNPMESGSGQNRIESMMIALEVFWKNPIFGSGYYESGNVYTEMMALYGILGIIIFLAIMGFLYFNALRYRRSIKNPQMDIYSVALGCSILCMMVTMLINSTFFRVYYWIIFGFILARYRIARTNISQQIKISGY